MCSKNRSKSSKTSGAGSIRAMCASTHQFSCPRAAWRLAARRGGELCLHLIPGTGFPCCQNLCPALVCHPIEVIVQLELVDGLGYGVDDEGVGGFAGTRGRHRHTSFQVIVNSDGGRRHGSLHSLQTNYCSTYVLPWASLEASASRRQARDGACACLST